MAVDRTGATVCRSQGAGGAVGARTGGEPDERALAKPRRSRSASQVAGHRGATRPWQAAERGCGRDAVTAEMPSTCFPRNVVGVRRHAGAPGGEMDYDGAAQTRRAPRKWAMQQPLPGPCARSARVEPASGQAAASRENCPRDALTARAAVLTIARSKGSKRKDSRVDEEALIAWQDVLDMVLNGRPNEVGCPYCNHRPLTIEEIEQTTRISCSKCGKFIQGRFAQ